MPEPAERKQIARVGLLDEGPPSIPCLPSSPHPNSLC